MQHPSLLFAAIIFGASRALADEAFVPVWDDFVDETALATATTDAPTSSPPSPLPTTKHPTPANGCSDAPDWVDAAGNGCEFYEQNDDPGCPHFGNSNEGSMGVADDNCCWCWGTTAVSDLYALVLLLLYAKMKANIL